MDIIESFLHADPGTTCEHLPGTLPTPASETCEGCGSGFNLRMCTACGHVGCCESQAGHARSHALTEAHPVIVGMPVGRGVTWCYEEDRYVG
jgi:CPA1 family monovalent cation:H+ antiporter